MFENTINKLGKKNIDRWIIEFIVMFFAVGLFEFFYIWLNRYELVGYSRFATDYSFKTFMVMFLQVYSVLFLPIFIYLGFKYRNSNRFNSKKIKIFITSLFIFMFSLLIYNFNNVFTEWVFLFMFIFIVILLKFNFIFAVSFSYLSFYCANMLFEFQGLNFLYNFGTLLSYILVFGLFALTIYKLKIKINLLIYLSFIPVVCMWIFFYPIWQMHGTEFNLVFTPYGLYVRLFTFPFFLTIALHIENMAKLK